MSGARWPRVLAALACAALGWGAWEAFARALPEADTARWTLRGASVPVEGLSSRGPLRLDPGALDLWAYRGASPRLAPFAEAQVSLTARVPDDGQLVLRFGASSTAGPEQPVRFGYDPGAGRERVDASARTTPAGKPGSPGPGGGGPGGPGGPGGGASSRSPADRTPALIVDRSARDAIFGRNLQCDPAPAPPERFTLDIAARGGDLQVSVDGAPVTRCRGTWGPGALVLGAGILRVQVDALTVAPAGAAPLVETFGGPHRSPLAGLVAALLCGALGARIRRPAWAFALLPALAVPLLGRLDMRGALDVLRLLTVPEAFGPLLLAGLPTAAALLLVAGGTAATLRGAALRGLAGLAVGALGAALAPKDTAGWLLLGALGVPLAVLAHVNTHPFARRVPVSWALTLVLAIGAEGALRLTALDHAWTRSEGWRRASEEFAELIELRQYRSYPDEGFPVRPPDPDPQRRRVVALGGSSTGGAYQMDDLDLFWPKRLAERLAGTDWEVVNQGVGGWNTLHVRLYVESQIERLDADVLVVYVGHNDLLSTAPVPYRELYASWSGRGSGARAVVDALNASRLYVGLKFGLLALFAGDGAIAVPVADARENLAAIIATASAHGARTLLVTEGLNPDPLPMREYGRMQAALAEQTGSLYLDAASELWRAADPDLFLDDCHLSVPGHVRLAGMVHETLRAAGWLDAPAAGRTPSARGAPPAGAAPPAGGTLGR